MTADEIRDALRKAGLGIKEESRLPNDTGVQIHLQNGAIVNCFDSGKYSVQGKNQNTVTKALSVQTEKGTSSSCRTGSDKVFAGPSRCLF